MDKKIEAAIRETLVIGNPVSVKRCVDKLKFIFEQEQALRQANVSLSLPPRSEVEQWFTGQDTVPTEYWQEAPYRTNGDVYEQVYEALEWYMGGGNAS